MFSIIMPVWNRAQIVKRAIQSVLNQTFPDYELIIVDDGSEDNLPVVIIPFLSEKVLFYQIPHQGVSVARNYGLKLARYQIIAYLDSDNVWHPQFLERMYLEFNKATPIIAAYCKYNIYRQNQDKEVFLAKIGGRPFNYQELLQENYIDLNAFAHKRECLDFCGYHNEQLKRLTDWEFILRIVAKYPIVFVPDILVDYYFLVFPNSITGNERYRVARWFIEKEIKMMSGPIRLDHDGIYYTWRNVPDEKMHNWVRMQNKEFNISDYTAWGYPYILQIEPTSICNLSCPLCPCGNKELNRQSRHMTLEEFQKIIDNMKKYLLFLILWDWGEPLTNPDFPAMIRYAASCDIKTVTSTNGHFFNNTEYMTDLLQSGLTTLIIAVDSTSVQNYQVYRKQGDMNEVLSGVEKIVHLKKKLKSKTILNLRMVVMKQNENEVAKTRRYAQKIGMDCFTVKTLNPNCGNANLDTELVPNNPQYRRFAYQKGTMERIRDPKPCRRIWHMSNIFSNGDVVPCCYDFASGMKVGNVFENPFTEIWNSENYRSLRKLIYHQRESIPKCNDCITNFKESIGMIQQVKWFHYPEDHIADKFRNLLLPPQIRRIAKEIRRIKGNLGR